MPDDVAFTTPDGLRLSGTLALSTMLAKRPCLSTEAASPARREASSLVWRRGWSGRRRPP
ncbi:MAG: hypothetical protein ACRDTA_16370 [Pseudonocardiaceae bacterium]